jgi:hypothetical protein
VARRSIEMYEYRQALMRMRQGDSEREIARSKLMGRSKAARFRKLARAQGWLDPERPLARARRPGEQRTVSDHLPPAAQRFFAHDRSWCLQQAREIGDACAQLIGQLLSDRISERLRAAQGVLALKGQYGAARLEAACERAIAHDRPHYRTVKTILAGGHDLAPVRTITPEPYAGRARFARATASLFEDDGPTFH